MSSSATSEIDPGKDAFRIQFFGHLVRLLKGLRQCFPECVKTPLVLTMMGIDPNDPDSLVTTLSVEHQHGVIKQYHETMAPYYEAVHQRDVEVFRSVDIDWIAKLDIVQKWDDPNFSATSRQALFKYIDKLNFNAQMYAGVPNALLAGIKRAACSVTGKIARRELFDLQAEAQRIMDSLSEGDQQSFADSVPGLVQQLGGLQGIAAVFNSGQMPSIVNSEIGQSLAQSREMQELAHNPDIMEAVAAGNFEAQLNQFRTSAAQTSASMMEKLKHTSTKE